MGRSFWGIWGALAQGGDDAGEGFQEVPDLGLGGFGAEGHTDGAVNQDGIHAHGFQNMTTMALRASRACGHADAFLLQPIE